MIRRMRKCHSSPIKKRDHRALHACGRILRNLNLPAALDALEKPIGLPPSLLQKADEVRTENGPQRVAREIEDVGALAKRDIDILEDVRTPCC